LRADDPDRFCGTLKLAEVGLDFLACWRREIEAVLNSVQIAHNHLIGPAA
jgi:uncharacterized protein Usg